MKRQHYMFRAFFDKNNEWWDNFVYEYEEEPVGVKKDFDLETELKKLLYDDLKILRNSGKI